MSDTSAPGLYTVTSVLLGLAVLAVALRFYARHHQKAALLADDWLLVPALLCFVGVSTCMFYGVHLRVFGYSSFDFTKEEKMATQERSAKMQLAFSLLVICCLGLTKLSALFFYKRIFCVGGRKAILNIIVTASLVIVALWLVTFLFILGFQCGTHFSSQWKGNSIKYCWRVYPLLLASTISDTILEVWVLALPIYPVLKLQTTPRRKAAILGILLMASTGIGASIARLYVQIQMSKIGHKGYVGGDGEHMLSRFYFFVVLEIGVSMVAICLPSIWMVMATKAPEAFLRSVNSIVSLASIGSKNSKGSQERPQPKTLQSNASTSSHIPIAGSSSGSYELDTAKNNNLEAVLERDIKAKDSIEHSSEVKRHVEV